MNLQRLSWFFFFAYPFLIFTYFQRNAIKFYEINVSANLIFRIKKSNNTLKFKYPRTLDLLIIGGVQGLPLIFITSLAIPPFSSETCDKRVPVNG